MNGPLSAPDLLGLVNREITPDVIHRAALQLGESDEHIRLAVSTSVPSVLTALSDVASSDTGAAHLTRMIRGIDANRAETDSVSSLLGSTLGREQGTTLFDGETGARGAEIADAVAHASGVTADSAHQLLGGATGAALLAIGRNADRLEPQGLRAMFGEQRGEFVRRLPAPVASLFDGAEAAPPLPAPLERPQAVERPRPVGPSAIRRLDRHERRGWLAPVILLAALFLVAVPLMRALRRPVVRVAPIGGLPGETMRGAAVPLSLPNGQILMVREGSPTEQLAAFMAGSQATPARFTLGPLNFEFGSAQLTPESMATLDEVAAILRAYPTATIRVESYTDSVGTAASNLELSRDRSETVKGLLGGKGIEPMRVATAGLGQENPVASNETEAGRAQNRRTDIVVTGR